MGISAVIEVSVIVPNHDRKELLASCLESLMAQRFGNFEAIVVDNGSKDGSREFLKSRETDKLRAVFLDANLGFAAACNAGIAVARGRYIATLNNDAQADPFWLHSLVKAMDSSPQSGMASSKILVLPEKRIIDKVGHLIYLDGLNHGRGCGEIDHGQFDIEKDCLFPDGAAALYRKDMLDQIGGFDERFFAYGDDCDLGLRARRAGWPCVYVPEARAYHLHSATAGRYSSLKAFLIERNRIWVAIKNFPLPLLLASPFFTLIRFAAQAFGAIFRIGPSGRFAQECTRAGLLLAIARAYLSAAAGAPAMWRSRAALRKTSRVSSANFMKLLWKHRCPLGPLALGVRSGDY